MKCNRRLGKTAYHRYKLHLLMVTETIKKNEMWGACGTLMREDR
jgi:hypothetical protein